MTRAALSLLAAAVVLLPAAAQESARVPLEWKLKKGQKLRYELTQDASFTHGDQAQRQTNTLGLALEVSDVDAQGTATLACTFDRVKLSAGGSGYAPAFNGRQRRVPKTGK